MAASHTKIQPVVSLCHLLSRKDFRMSFVKAMKDEASCLPIATYAENVIIFFDDWDQDTQVDYDFASDLTHTFSGYSIHVIPVFITHSEHIATKLCYLNRGVRMRPFPKCMDLACDWQVGDGKQICRIGDKIDWIFPAWSRDDKAGIMDGQEVVVTSPDMCSGISNKMVPMLVPNDRSFFDGKSPSFAMDGCSRISPNTSWASMQMAAVSSH